MITHDEIIDSIKYVVDNSKYVKINKDEINKVIDIIKNHHVKTWLDYDYLGLQDFNEDQIMLYLILCESLNFCYWDSLTKWKAEYKGEWYSGSYGLFYAISKAIHNGYNLLDINYLDKITKNEVDEIFKGTTSIPLLDERYHIIKELAHELKDIKDIKECHNDVELLNKIINHFHNFNDISIYKGRKVYFFKRAILLVGDLITNISSLKKRIPNDDMMVGCADYKIPQVLRAYNILEYNKELEDLVDNKELIEHDSEMEIEIRANMLYAIELIKEEMHKKGIMMNSVQIDNALWLLSKNKDFKAKPYHHTRTIYY